jgi:hypothetical protein
VLRRVFSLVELRDILYGSCAPGDLSNPHCEEMLVAMALLVETPPVSARLGW